MFSIDDARTIVEETNDKAGFELVDDDDMMEEYNHALAMAEKYGDDAEKFFRGYMRDYLYECRAESAAARQHSEYECCPEYDYYSDADPGL